MRRALIGAMLVLLVILFAPLVAVFAEALQRGVAFTLASLEDPDARHAIGLTLTVAAIVVPLNAVFGIAAAWAIPKFDWRGKSILLTLIDPPSSVSPVMAGLSFVLLFGANTAIGAWLVAHGSRSSSRFRTSCWRRCSSPSRSSPAS